MAWRETFQEPELIQFSDALHVAEESVSDHYRLSRHTWGRYPFEVRTGRDLLEDEVEDLALAQVVRMRQPSRPGHLRGWDFFRICVQDHNLLEAVRREPQPDLLLPLMAYVLTHELVHVVRFYQFQHLFETSERQRAEEEARVHEITAQVLGRVKLARLDQVISLYQEYGTDDWPTVPSFVGQGAENADLRISVQEM